VNFNQGCKEIASFFLKAKWEFILYCPSTTSTSLLRKKTAGYFSRLGGGISLEKNRGFFQLFNFVFRPNLSLKDYLGYSGYLRTLFSDTTNANT